MNQINKNYLAYEFSQKVTKSYEYIEGKKARDISEPCLYLF